jgi:phage terminase small subunit
MQKLSAKQEQFCREYLVDLNATQAAIRAGYSPKTAYSMGQRLLKNVEVQAFIQRAKQERAEKLARTAQDVLNDLFLYTREAHENGDLRTAMKGIELQLKHFGELTDKVKSEVSGPNGGPIDNQLTIRLVRPHHADR